MEKSNRRSKMGTTITIHQWAPVMLPLGAHLGRFTGPNELPKAPPQTKVFALMPPLHNTFDFQHTFFEHFHSKLRGSTLRAFLSHSSKDKYIVEKVADALGSANVIIDSRSFEYGIPNEDAILSQLHQSDLFVLFLSANSLLSKYVDSEARYADKLIRAGEMDKFLTICLDQQSFLDAKPIIKRFNAVRKISSPNAITRRITAELIAIDTQSTRSANVFVGRAAEIAEVERQLIDPTNASVTSIFVSGLTGIGRRSFAQQIYKRVFPQVNTIFPTIIVEQNDGYEEIYRKLVSINEPFTVLKEALDLFGHFESLTIAEKNSVITSVLRDIVDQREAVVFLDAGGLLGDDGSVNPTILSLCQHAPTSRHPCVIAISQRSIPARLRDDLNSFVFSSLKALPDSDCRTIFGLLLKHNDVQYTSNELDELVALADGHPHNIQMVVRFCKQYGVSAFINDPTDLISWKHRRGFEYIQQFKFTEIESLILSLLGDFPHLEGGMLFDAVGADSSAVIATALRRLIDLNIVDVVEGDYVLSPPMRVAVERDDRFNADQNAKMRAVRSIAKSFVALESGDVVNNSLIESGILASLYSGEEMSSHIAALTLPSQHVWLAQKLYDRKNYRAAMSKAREALKGRARLSHDGIMEAHRLTCLCASRLGDTVVFDKFIRSLSEVSKTQRDTASLDFLRGFHARILGNVPEAESFFMSAYNKNLRNYSVLRELSALFVATGRYTDAEKYARRAYEIAPDNPFVVDILVGCLIGKGHSSATGSAEVDALMEHLRQIEGDDMSFYEVRMAEIALQNGNIEDAVSTAKKAIKKTPWMFSAHSLLAGIELRRNNLSAVADEIKSMQKIVDDPANMERKSGLRALLETKIKYMMATGDFDGARSAYRSSAFSELDRTQGLKEVDYFAARSHRQD